MLYFQALFLDAFIMKEGEIIEKNNKRKVIEVWDKQEIDKYPLKKEGYKK